MLNLGEGEQGERGVTTSIWRPAAALGEADRRRGPCRCYGQSSCGRRLTRGPPSTPVERHVTGTLRDALRFRTAFLACPALLLSLCLPGLGSRPAGLSGLSARCSGVIVSKDRLPPIRSPLPLAPERTPEGCVATFKKKHESDGSGRPGAVSCSHSEQLVDELNLSPNIRTVHPPRLPLPDHVHGLVSSDRSLRRVEFTKALLRLHSSFDRSMILLQDVVQVLDRAVAATASQDSNPFTPEIAEPKRRAWSVLMTRGCGCDGSGSALRNRRSAAAASRNPESMTPIVAPVESMTRSR